MMNSGGAPNNGSTADTVRSVESAREVQEFIREFNGRGYNAQNTMYFLPAGQSESESLILQRYLSHPPVPFLEGSVTHDLFHLSR